MKFNFDILDNFYLSLCDFHFHFIVLTMFFLYLVFFYLYIFSRLYDTNFIILTLLFFLCFLLLFLIAFLIFKHNNDIINIIVNLYEVSSSNLSNFFKDFNSTIPSIVGGGLVANLNFLSSNLNANIKEIFFNILNFNYNYSFDVQSDSNSLIETNIHQVFSEINPVEISSASGSGLESNSTAGLGSNSTSELELGSSSSFGSGDTFISESVDTLISESVDSLIPVPHSSSDSNYFDYEFRPGNPTINSDSKIFLEDMCKSIDLSDSSSSIDKNNPNFLLLKFVNKHILKEEEFEIYINDVVSSEINLCLNKYLKKSKEFILKNFTLIDYCKTIHRGVFFKSPYERAFMEWNYDSFKLRFSQLPFSSPIWRNFSGDVCDLVKNYEFKDHKGEWISLYAKEDFDLGLYIKKRTSYIILPSKVYYVNELLRNPHGCNCKNCEYKVDFDKDLCSNYISIKPEIMERVYEKLNIECASNPYYPNWTPIPLGYSKSVQEMLIDKALEDSLNQRDVVWQRKL